MSSIGKRNDHAETELRYQAFRDIVYENTMQEFPGLIAKGIEFSDCVTVDGWKSDAGQNNRKYRGSWDWAREFPFYQNRPNRFEISLWADDVICALCYGQTSKHGSRVRMNLIESIPTRPTPLGRRALPVIAFSAATFAEIVGATELWVLDPDPNLEDIYRNEGFGGRQIYHGRRVGQRRLI